MGPNEGDNGYLYISYYDKTFTNKLGNGFSALAFVNVEATDNYADIYQYNPLGNTFISLGFNNETAYMKNTFNATNNNSLAAFGIYTYSPNSSYEVTVVVDGKTMLVDEGTIVNAGYNTIKLSNLVPLVEGKTFNVIVKLTIPNNLCPIAIECIDDRYTNKARFQLGQSFVSKDGKNWNDINAYTYTLCVKDYPMASYFNNGNVCLKAYTVVSEDNSFTALAKLIEESNGTVYLEHDYIYDPSTDSQYVDGININKQLEFMVMVIQLVELMNLQYLTSLHLLLLMM